jgi:hypothetical protein
MRIFRIKKLQVGISAILALTVVGGSIFGLQPIYASSSTAAPEAAGNYLVPAITDNPIQPGSISAATPGNISVKGSPGEYLSASIAVNASKDISGMTVNVSVLTGSIGTISKDNINIRVVKSWYQAGTGLHDTKAKTLVPELLLKDDSLIPT